MRVELRVAFTAASAIRVVVPGSTILLVVSDALGRGGRTALPMATGVASGDVTARTLSMPDARALLTASSTALGSAG